MTYLKHDPVIPSMTYLIYMTQFYINQIVQSMAYLEHMTHFWDSMT